MGESYIVAARLLTHYQVSARDLPWRRTHDPYAVLVSEVMLQQTQVSRVAPAFERFMRRFPTLSALAAAPLAAVLREWSGLGYNRRARDLQRIARLCPNGLPDTVAELDALPGIGAYTAGAVACFAFGQRVAFADVNIKRVLGRVFLGRPATDKEGVDLDARAVPDRNADLWHHALMDLGATICAAKAPTCELCPLQTDCLFARSPAVGGRTARVARPAAYTSSDRRVRGAIVRSLVQAETGLTLHALEKQLADARVPRLIEALVADGLIERSGRRYRLPT